MFITTKASHIIFNKTLVIKYDWSFLFTSRLRLFIDGNRTGSTSWDFLKDYVTLTKDISIDGQPVTLEVTVDHRAKAYDISIDGQLVLSSNFQAQANQALPSWWRLMVFSQVFWGVPCALLGYSGISEFHNLGLKSALHAFFIANVVYFTARYQAKKSNE